MELSDVPLVNYETDIMLEAKDTSLTLRRFRKLPRKTEQSAICSVANFCVFCGVLDKTQAMATFDRVYKIFKTSGLRCSGQSFHSFAQSEKRYWRTGGKQQNCALGLQCVTTKSAVIWQTKSK